MRIRAMRQCRQQLRTITDNSALHGDWFGGLHSVSMAITVSKSARLNSVYSNHAHGPSVGYQTNSTATHQTTRQLFPPFCMNVLKDVTTKIYSGLSVHRVWRRVIRGNHIAVHENQSADIRQRVHLAFGWRDVSQARYYPEGGTSSSETSAVHSDYPEYGSSKVIHNVTNYQSSRRRIPEDNLQISTPGRISCTINPLKTKRNLLYIRNESVPRSKHFPPRL